MIALQAVKCMPLLRALCGCCATFLLKALADGLDRLQLRAQTHAWRVNTIDCSPLRRRHNQALRFPLSLHACARRSTPIHQLDLAFILVHVWLCPFFSELIESEGWLITTRSSKKTERLDVAECSDVLQARRAILQQHLLATAMKPPSFLIRLAKMTKEKITVHPIPTPPRCSHLHSSTNSIFTCFFLQIYA